MSNPAIASASTSVPHSGCTYIMLWQMPRGYPAVLQVGQALLTLHLIVVIELATQRYADIIAGRVEQRPQTPSKLQAIIYCKACTNPTRAWEKYTAKTFSTECAERMYNAASHAFTGTVLYTLSCCSPSGSMHSAIHPIHPNHASPFLAILAKQ